ncbi:peptidoglycan-binding domain-containing protein [Luedemannella helvata]|uniref:Peptidoglycan-binding protein n=1 Tax=Luedemannella helvata TaxID=349315 RepID=A0ABN2KX26_9ACTN
MSDEPQSGDRRADLRGWRRRRRCRAWLIAGAVVVVAAVGAGAGIGFGRPGRPAATASPQPAATATVAREDLVDYVTMTGTIGYGEGQPLGVKAGGTVTWLPAPGATIRRGQPVTRVDDRPVVLLYGPLPMYRTLTAGTEGNDVKQFERNLAALGYDGFDVDAEFSSATAAAVRRWQRDLGLTETGSVAADRVVYASAALRVAERLVRVGAEAPDDVLTVTGTTRVVSATIDADEAGWAEPGRHVGVLVGEREVRGTVTGVHDGSGQGGESSATVTITIEVSDQKALAQADAGLVVRYAARTKKAVLTVPVAALLALAEGGYGLEVIDPATTATRIVAVQAGMFAGGRVEVSGPDIEVGTTVRMPR